MFSNIRNYISDNKFRMNIYDNQLNVVNYLDVMSLEDNRISVKYSNGTIIIKGNNLSINKLLEQEMLITGDIKSIEFE